MVLVEAGPMGPASECTSCLSTLPCEPLCILHMHTVIYIIWNVKYPARCLGLGELGDCLRGKGH